MSRVEMKLGRSGAALLAVAAALLGVACGQPRPPTDKPLEAGAAMRLIWDAVAIKGPSVPVYGVEHDPSCTVKYAVGNPGSGFRDPATGVCVGGVTINREAIWLVLPPAPYGRVFSDSLPHEAMHLMGWDHASVDWSHDEPVGVMRDQAQLALFMNPGINAIQ